MTHSNPVGIKQSLTWLVASCIMQIVFMHGCRSTADKSPDPPCTTGNNLLMTVLESTARSAICLCSTCSKLGLHISKHAQGHFSIMLLAQVTQSSDHIHQVGVALHVRTGARPLCVTALGLVLTEPLCQLADAATAHAWSCLWRSKTLQQIMLYILYYTVCYTLYDMLHILHYILCVPLNPLSWK